MKKTLLFIACLQIGMYGLKAQTLYSVTPNGGANNVGTIFKFAPASNTLTVVKAFVNTPSPHSATGSLILASNGKLYSTTYGGGSINTGTLYSMDTATGAITTLVDFTGFNGSSPIGNPIQANNGKLYGTTVSGGTGSRNAGTLYSYDIATSTYTTLHSFTGYQDGAGNDGYQPFATLVQANNGKLYGTTRYGGNSNTGTIYSFDPASNTYAKIYQFSGSGTVFSSLIQASNGLLYGTTAEGGTYNYGTIYSFNLATSAYTKLFDFNNTNGATPNGKLVQAGNGKFYGMTFGGANNMGYLYEFDPVTNTYTTKKDFSAADGFNPYGHLFQASDGKLYGLTSSGGANNLGVVFSYNYSTSVFTKLKDLDAVSGANPYYGTGFIELTNSINPVPTRYFRDSDGDGYGDGFVSIRANSSTPPAGYVANDWDCDDHKTTTNPQLERIRMCKNGVLECDYVKDISAKLALGYTLGLCPRAPAARTSGVAAEITLEEKTDLPKQYALSNYPNPFAGASIIRYELPYDSKVSIKVYDQLGRAITTLVNEAKKAGTYSVRFDASKISSGSLYYRIVAQSKNGQFEQTNKMIQVK